MNTIPRFITVLPVIVLLLALLHQPAAGSSPKEALSPAAVNGAAMKLVQFCIEPRAGLDEQAIAILVDHVMSPKQNREYALPKSLGSTGAYYEFDTKITFLRFMEYSYGSLTPPSITRPSSLRYSIWSSPRGKTQKLPESWKPLPPPCRGPGHHPRRAKRIRHPGPQYRCLSRICFEKDADPPQL